MSLGQYLGIDPLGYLLESTEVLTPHGWVSPLDLKVGTQVVTFLRGRFQFDFIEKVFTSPYISCWDIKRYECSSGSISINCGSSGRIPVVDIKVEKSKSKLLTCSEIQTDGKSPYFWSLGVTHKNYRKYPARSGGWKDAHIFPLTEDYLPNFEINSRRLTKEIFLDKKINKDPDVGRIQKTLVGIILERGTLFIAKSPVNRHGEHGQPFLMGSTIKTGMEA